MSLPPSAIRRRAAIVLLAAAMLLGGACSSSDDDGAPEDTSTTVTPILVGGGGDRSLAGSWRSDAGDLLEETFQTEGFEGEISCEAEMVLELGPEGAFTQTIAGSCLFPEGTGEVEVEQTGRYRGEDGTIRFADVDGEGVVRADDGRELTIGDGAALATDLVELPYTVDAGVLVIGDPDAGDARTFEAI